MPAATIDFWFTMGSTYTALTVARHEALAARAGVTIRLRPMKSVGALTGGPALPFIEGTAKHRYMWRDIARRAAAIGMPLRLPVAYPAPSGARANRVALLGVQEGWAAPYLRAAYRLWFAEGIGNGGEENLRAALAEAGQAAEIDRILAQADGDANTAALDAETDIARALGVFGSPSFIADGELFWGDDHLEDAIAWAKR
jgi:2-hydroxychromene-2-carboxylate isomerase